MSRQSQEIAIQTDAQAPAAIPGICGQVTRIIV